MAGWLATEGLKHYRSPLLAGMPEVVHGFFTRQGGVSTGAYESLNVSLAVGDGREAVAENLGRMRQALGLAELAGAAQVHGRRAAVITSPEQARPTDIPEVDILVTTVPGLGLLIKQADCQAVMFYDPVQGVAANVHCGWRGQVANILGETVALLQARFGTRPSDLYAAVGPSLGPCCAEIKNFRREIPQALWGYQVRPTYFDLWRLSRDQLAAAGLERGRIDLAGLCTRCGVVDFYSYRRDRVTGRQGAVIALRA
jgi:purine-nucleoside/S-methyl-5'-thioadenosine phosphorylase / adenosine deaminase